MRHGVEFLWRLPNFRSIPSCAGCRCIQQEDVLRVYKSRMAGHFYVSDRGIAFSARIQCRAASSM